MSQQVYEKEEKGVFEIFQDDMANIKTTMENLNLEEFRKTVEVLLEAKRVIASPKASFRKNLEPL